MATVLITGANRGIGLEFVRQYAARGDTILACCRRPEQADDLRANLRTDTSGIFELDVMSDQSVRLCRDAIGLRPIDILINNAGVIGPDRQATTDMDYDGFARTLNINTIGPLRVANAFLDNVEAGTGKTIATISSRMGSFGFRRSDRIAYRASKTAVNRVMVALADDLKPAGVSVAVYHPGWVQTEMGGANADIDVTSSVTGLIAAIDGQSQDRSGRFFAYDGAELDW